MYGAYLRQGRVARYKFIGEERARYPVGMLCRVMRVSESAYHDSRRGKSHVVIPQKAAIGERVRTIFYGHRRRYGARRIAEQMKAEGVRAGRRILPRRIRGRRLCKRHETLQRQQRKRA